jgi:hypothetical protein
MISKTADMESSGMTDPETQRPIRISTTVRKNYRYYFDAYYSYREDYTGIRNKDLNEIIARDFAASAGGVLHMFPSNSSSFGSDVSEWIEIRKVSGRAAFHFFFSVIRSSGIDLIGTSTRYKKPRSATTKNSSRYKQSSG